MVKRIRYSWRFEWWWRRSDPASPERSEIASFIDGMIPQLLSIAAADPHTTDVEFKCGDDGVMSRLKINNIWHTLPPMTDWMACESANVARQGGHLVSSEVLRFFESRPRLQSSPASSANSNFITIEGVVWAISTADDGSRSLIHLHLDK